DYGPGVRYVYFADGGTDTEFWGGNYGSVMMNAQVKIQMPTIEVTQTAGLESGDEFPIGITTNTYEIVQGEEAPTNCSFNINVVDVEAPVAKAKNIELELPEEQIL